VGEVDVGHGGGRQDCGQPPREVLLARIRRSPSWFSHGYNLLTTLKMVCWFTVKRRVKSRVERGRGLCTVRAFNIIVSSSRPRITTGDQRLGMYWCHIGGIQALRARQPSYPRASLHCLPFAIVSVLVASNTSAAFLRITPLQSGPVTDHRKRPLASRISGRLRRAEVIVTTLWYPKASRQQLRHRDCGRCWECRSRPCAFTTTVGRSVGVACVQERLADPERVIVVNGIPCRAISNFVVIGKDRRG